MLQLALKVKEHCPHVIFNVHFSTEEEPSLAEKVAQEQKDREQERALQERFARERRLSDPFLEVVLGEESYFIAVWDEEDFDELDALRLT